MTANTCVVCGSPTPDGWACMTETERARQQLAEIAETVEAARAVMYRQTSTGDTIHSTPGPRDLLDYGAGARLDAVQTALTGWVRAVREDAKVKSAPRKGDLIAACADWLAERVETIRHLEYADEVLREIGDCWHTMRSVVATPAGRLYLGVCEDGGCGGDVFGKPGRAAAYCNQCGAVYDQDERRVQVATLVEGGSYRASQLDGYRGLSAATVRKWAERGLITPHEHDGRGRPLYLLTEVRAVQSSEEQRLQQSRQKRYRRGAEVVGVTPG